MAWHKIWFTWNAQMLERSIIGILFVLALALRLSFYPAFSGDMSILTSWTDFIQTHGGFAALKHDFSNYNVPYLYLLTFISYIPIPAIVLIKTISVIFDGVLAFFVYRIIRLRYPHDIAAVVGALTMLFVPTVFINSAAWGQCDSIYTAFCIGSLYFLLRDRAGWACTFFGLAIAFKLQAIFFAPVLLILLLTRKLPLKAMFLIPALFLLLLVPAFVAGRDVVSLLTIYVDQIRGGGPAIVEMEGTPQEGNESHQPPMESEPESEPSSEEQQISSPDRPQGPTSEEPTLSSGDSEGPTLSPGDSEESTISPGKQENSSSTSPLTMNAPSIYQWFPSNAGQTTISISAVDTWQWMGIILAGTAVILIAFLVVASKKQITDAILIKITLVLVLIIPFLLPKMHERYFYLADILSIIYAFYFPRRFYIPVVVQLCSLLSYMPFLFGTPVIDLKYVAFGVLLATLITLADVVLTLYPNVRNLVGIPAIFNDEIPLETNKEEIPEDAAKADTEAIPEDVTKEEIGTHISSFHITLFCIGAITSRK